MKTQLQAFTVIILCAWSTVLADPGPDEWVGLANKGDVGSMVSLGVMYHSGDGVKVDYTKAMDWYLMAYAKADGDAVNNIAVLFRDGLGVPKNEKVAYILFLVVHMEGLGTDATQQRAGRSLGKLADSLKKEDLHEALSYTLNYVDQIVKSRGKNLKTGMDVLPTNQRPRIRDNGWWLDSERKGMDFKSPAPWDKVYEDPRGDHKPTPDMAISIPFDDDKTKWKMQFLDGNALKMIAEFTPNDQEIKNWKEMVAQEITFTPKKVSEHLTEWKAMITKADPNVEIKEVQNDDGSVTVVYKSESFNEYSIRRFMKSTDGIYALAYHIRLNLYSEERAKTWAAIIKKSNLIPNPSKK